MRKLDNGEWMIVAVIITVFVVLLATNGCSCG